MLPQDNISDTTPTGATLVHSGVTFRVFAPMRLHLPEIGTRTERWQNIASLAALARC
jgi:hypothetical protein